MVVKFFLSWKDFKIGFIRHHMMALLFPLPEISQAIQSRPPNRKGQWEGRELEGRLSGKQSEIINSQASIKNSYTKAKYSQS